MTSTSTESTTSEIGSIAAKLRTSLTQLGDSTSELTKMSIESELTIREHCDSVRRQVDIARELAIESIHKESNALMTEIDAYERECCSGWQAVEESTKEAVVEDVSKRARAFLAKQQSLLQSLSASDASETELQLHLDEANKLAQELTDRKTELKAAMFGNKLASFNAFPSTADATSLGELTFTNVQLPFKSLNIAGTKFKSMVIRDGYEFVLPLDQGRCVVAFTNCTNDELIKYTTQMCSFDRLGRLLGSDSLYQPVDQACVAQCGPNEFVVCPADTDAPVLSVYDSHLQCLRTVSCYSSFLSLCCNSKFVFGLWEHLRGANDRYSRRSIQAYHLDSLSEAFSLEVPDKYTMERIMADEHHVVAMSQLEDREPSEWFMSVFDLTTVTTSNESSGDETDSPNFLVDSHFELSIETLSLSSVFLFEGWLVVPLKNELAWFDKQGKRSDTSTKWDSGYLKQIYSSGSSLLFGPNENTLLKR